MGDSWLLGTLFGCLDTFLMGCLVAWAMPPVRLPMDLAVCPSGCLSIWVSVGLGTLLYILLASCLSI